MADGCECDTGGTATSVLLNGNWTTSKYINGWANSSTNVLSVTTTSLTFHVSTSSGGGGSTPNKLTWQNVRVRPTAGTPLASGNLTKSGGSGTGSMVGVTDASTSFGQLTEVVGAASKLVFITQPGHATYGSPLR